MTAINKLSYELQDLVMLPKFENNISIISCIEETNYDYEINIKINNINFIIKSNFLNYCFIDSSIININELNQLILYSNYYKSLNNLIEAIYKFHNNTKINTIKYNIIIYNDTYNFYNKIEEKTKIYINYKELEINSSKNKKLRPHYINIPNELLLNYNQLYKLIINEIKKINSNYEYPHYIETINNNIFELKMTLILSNSKLVELKINLNPNLYPFLPPVFELISPNVKFELQCAIININISKICNWNSAISLEWIIINLALKLDNIIDEYIELDSVYDEIELNLLKFTNLININYTNKLNINLDIINFYTLDTPSNTNQTYWNSGTGYGSNRAGTNWDIKNYIREKEHKQYEILKYLEIINSKITNENIIFIKNSTLLIYILNITDGINMLELETNNNIFNEIFNILLKLINFSNFNKLDYNDFIINFTKNLKSMNEEIILLFEQNEEMKNNELYQNLYKVYNIYISLLEVEIIITKQMDINNLENEYCNIMKPLQFNTHEIASTHRFYDQKNNKLEPATIKRIISEISTFKSGLPLNFDSSIWIRISKMNMNIFTFIISGPKDTPYDNGLFEFHVYFPINYPNVEPKVLLNTTGDGTVRFNPNLYNSGKVCLSLLGTWSGQQSEKWNPKTSTFLQVLISIQSLILVEEPYFNEPGYESEMHTAKGKLKNKKYNNNLYIETIKYAMINMINNPPVGYEEVVIQHFKIKKNNIIETVNKWLESSVECFKPALIVQINLLTELLNKLN